MKKRIINAIVIVLCLVLVLSLCTSCKNNEDKVDYENLRQTGGTTDGSSISEDTSYDVIVSQKVSEDVWNKAIAAFGNSNNRISGTLSSDEAIDFDSLGKDWNSYSYKAVVTVSYSGVSVDSTEIGKCEGHKFYSKMSLPNATGYALTYSDSEYCGMTDFVDDKLQLI